LRDPRQRRRLARDQAVRGADGRRDPGRTRAARGEGGGERGGRQGRSTRRGRGRSPQAEDAPRRRPRTDGLSRPPFGQAARPGRHRARGFFSRDRGTAMDISAEMVRKLREETGAGMREREKEIYRAQAAAQGKPANVVERIAEGKLKDYYSTFCLLEQSFVKDQAKTVGQLVQEKIALIKENIVIRRFARFKVGEEVQATAKAPVDEPLVPAAR